MKTEENTVQARPLKILYHHRTQGRGAEGVHISSIVKALEALGHSVTILSPPGIDPVSTAGNAPVDMSKTQTKGIASLWKFISNYVPNFMFEVIEIIYNVPSLIRLEKELSQNKYDLIYERYAFYMVSGAIKAKQHKIPLILEANEVSGIKLRARKQSFSWLCHQFENFLFQRCTSIHTVSSYLKNRILEQGVALERITVAPNAIDPDKFNGKINVDNLKQKYAIRHDQTVIGFAGWFNDWDRLDLLMDVFKELRQKHSNLILLLIGDGPVLDQVRKKIKAYQLETSVVLTGAITRNRVHEYLSLLDIAAITHSNEFGSPVVMFEFMGLKIPIVAPRLSPITDVLTDGKNSVLFDVLNMHDLEVTLSDLITNKQKQKALSEAAFRTLMEKHTWHNNALEIITTAKIGVQN